MSGIADVARLAGVSKSTASRALTGGGYVSDERAPSP
jgi:DNA-binding LacI/PurR family transcriptional regulator